MAVNERSFQCLKAELHQPIHFIDETPAGKNHMRSHHSCAKQGGGLWELEAALTSVRSTGLRDGLHPFSPHHSQIFPMAVNERSFQCLKAELHQPIHFIDETPAGKNHMRSHHSILKLLERNAHQKTQLPDEEEAVRPLLAF